MKKRSAIFGFIGAIMILTSCNSSLDIVKRKYNNGYYLSICKNTHSKDANSASKDVTLEMDNSSLQTKIDYIAVDDKKESIISNELLLTASTDNLIAKRIVKKQTVLRKLQVSNQLLKNVLIDNPSKQITIVKQDNKLSTCSNNTDRQKRSDDHKILMIVLCFFIPPLAVYMHEDAINNKFWLNVVLTLLCGIPGIIHALIVVLG